MSEEFQSTFKCLFSKSHESVKKMVACVTLNTILVFIDFCCTYLKNGILEVFLILYLLIIFAE